jgi:hypothetical protein
VGGITVIFHEIDGYRALTWPAADVPMQIHLDFFADDLDEAEALLHKHGATDEKLNAKGESQRRAGYQGRGAWSCGCSSVRGWVEL